MLLAKVAMFELVTIFMVIAATEAAPVIVEVALISKVRVLTDIPEGIVKLPYTFKVDVENVEVLPVKFKFLTKLLSVPVANVTALDPPVNDKLITFEDVAPAVVPIEMV